MIARVDDLKIGRIVRALRRRLGWRQQDLAAKAGCSQATVSRVERGQLTSVSLPVLRRILASLEATVVIEVRWRAGALERLLDADHAALVGLVADLLRGLGWQVEVEVTYSEWGERGSYDILAFHAPTGTLLVVEIKTDLPSVEATLRKVDEKVRLAPDVARERFGWRARTVARLVVLPEHRTLRRRAAQYGRVLNTALPQRNVAVKRWLAAPAGPLAGLLFVPDIRGTSSIRRPGGRTRVDRRRSAPASHHAAA